MSLLSQALSQIQRVCWRQQQGGSPEVQAVQPSCCCTVLTVDYQTLSCTWFWTECKQVISGGGVSCSFISHINSFPLSFIMIALSAVPAETAGSWKHLQCFFFWLQGMEDLRKHRLLPTDSMEQGSKGWLHFRLATLLVDAVLLFWARGTEWIHWLTSK